MQDNPFQSPQETGYVVPTAAGGLEGVEYVGFGLRLIAYIVDIILAWIAQIILLVPFVGVRVVFGQEGMTLASWVSTFLFVAVVIAFWVGYGATPGKMLVSARIVDARTGAPVTLGQAIIRYVGYFISSFVCLIGFFWIAFNPRKQGWHDLLANTVVIKARPGGPVGRYGP